MQAPVYARVHPEDMGRVRGIRTTPHLDPGDDVIHVAAGGRGAGIEERAVEPGSGKRGDLVAGTARGHRLHGRDHRLNGSHRRRVREVYLQDALTVDVVGGGLAVADVEQL